MFDLRKSSQLMSAAAALALCAACVTTQAKARPPEAPALDPPPPPARVIAPLEPEEETTPPPTVAPDEPAKRPPAIRTTPRPQRESGGRGDAPKTEPPKPAEPEPAKPAEPPVEGPPPVHRLQPANEIEQERSIRDRLAAAERDLSHIDYGKLRTEMKEQYDTAKRLVEQAKDGLKVRNFVFADSLAEKAAALAASLKSSR